MANTAHPTTATTGDKPATTAGVRLHPGEVQRYRERNRLSFERLEQTKPLIPTGHAGGMWYQLPYPVLLERGEGSRVWDVDGNEYLDMRIGDWVMALGHRNEAVERGDRRPARQGVAARLPRMGPGLPHGLAAHRAHAVG